MIPALAADPIANAALTLWLEGTYRKAIIHRLSGLGESYGPAEDSALSAGAPQAKYNEVDARLRARQVKPALSQKAWIEIRDQFLFNASMSGMVLGATF